MSEVWAGVMASGWSWLMIRDWTWRDLCFFLSSVLRFNKRDRKGFTGLQKIRFLCSVLARFSKCGVGFCMWYTYIHIYYVGRGVRPSNFALFFSVCLTHVKLRLPRHQNQRLPSFIVFAGACSSALVNLKLFSFSKKKKYVVSSGPSPEYIPTFRISFDGPQKKSIYGVIPLL